MCGFNCRWLFEVRTTWWRALLLPLLNQLEHDDMLNQRWCPSLEINRGLALPALVSHFQSYRVIRRMLPFDLLNTVYTLFMPDICFILCSCNRKCVSILVLCIFLVFAVAWWYIQGKCHWERIGIPMWSWNTLKWWWPQCLLVFHCSHFKSLVSFFPSVALNGFSSKSSVLHVCSVIISQVPS